MANDGESLKGEDSCLVDALGFYLAILKYQLEHRLRYPGPKELRHVERINSGNWYNVVWLDSSSYDDLFDRSKFPWPGGFKTHCVCSLLGGLFNYR